MQDDSQAPMASEFDYYIYESILLFVITRNLDFGRIRTSLIGQL